MLPISFAGGILFGTVFAGLIGILIGVAVSHRKESSDTMVSDTMMRSHKDRRYMSKGLQNYYEGR